ncbi:MAG: replication-associated recombination protein A, partial [Acidobacteria bacterium]|nr:replication-associated recombination protein A [Acidobacteriota bacterium]
LREFGYGKGYEYAHDYAEKTTSMACLPEALRNRRYYLPTDQGYERTLKDRLLDLFKRREKS